MKKVIFYSLCVMALFTSCKSTQTVAALTCEMLDDGSYSCDVKGSPVKITKWCTYLVDRATGTDCDTLGIDTGTTICVQCDDSQTQCPAKTNFKVDGKDCTLKVHRLSGLCTSCPRDGVKVTVVK